MSVPRKATFFNLIHFKLERLICFFYILFLKSECAVEVLCSSHSRKYGNTRIYRWNIGIRHDCNQGCRMDIIVNVMQYSTYCQVTNTKTWFQEGYSMFWNENDSSSMFWDEWKYVLFLNALFCSKAILRSFFIFQIKTDDGFW